MEQAVIKRASIVKHILDDDGIDPHVAHQERLKAATKQLKYLVKFKYIGDKYKFFFFSDSKYQEDVELGKIFIEHFEDEDSKGIYIGGTKGTGKTRLAMMIANELALKGKKVLMIHTNEGIDAYNDKNDEVFKHLIDTKYFDLIVLDDYGTFGDIRFQTKQIYNFINAVYESGAIVIITSNLSRRDLRDEKDPMMARTNDRIIGMTDYFPPKTGESRRFLESSSRAEAMKRRYTIG